MYSSNYILSQDFTWSLRFFLKSFLLFTNNIYKVIITKQYRLIVANMEKTENIKKKIKIIHNIIQI